MPAQVAARQLAQVNAADPNAAGLHVVEPVEQLHERALAGAGAAQNGEGLALPDGKGEVVQDLLPLVAEADMVKLDVAGGKGLRVRRVGLLLGVQDVAHAVHGHAGLAHLRQHAAQRTHRPRQRFVVGHKGEEGAESHAAVHGFDHAEQDDDHDL